MIGILSTSAVAQNIPLQPLLPETLRWIDRPGDLPRQAAWVLGAEQKPEPYLIRVKLKPAGVPHFLEARDVAVVYQEAGVGPTGTVWVKP